MQISLVNQLTTPLVLFFCGLIIRATFAFFETSIAALRLFRLKELSKEMGGAYDRLFAVLEKEPHRVIITTLLASNVADSVTAALGSYIMGTIFSYFNFSEGLGFTVGVGISSITIFIFGETIPKNFARERGEQTFRNMLWFLNGAYYLLYPIVSILLRFSDAIIYRLGGSEVTQTGGDWVTSEREIRFLIDYIHDKGIIEPEKTQMLRNIFDLSQKQTRDIMVPEADIISVEINTSIKDLLQVFSNFQFTRLPVYEKTTDNIVGMIHQKDVFAMITQQKEKLLREIVRPIGFVPESVRINQLLRELRQQQWHIAIVLNEHGSMTGLITLEDVLEEIVGEISDEHEPLHEKVVALAKGGWLIDASITLDDLGSLLNITFEVEDAVTLAGFMMEYLQHLPKVGEEFAYKKYVFHVQKATDKRINQVHIYKEPTKNEENASLSRNGLSA